MEATALIRQSGHWSVVLGPDRWLRHFVRDPQQRMEVGERRLALLALWLGSELMRRLLHGDAETHLVRVRLLGNRAIPGGPADNTLLSVDGVITVDGDESGKEVNRWLPILLKSDSLLSQTDGTMRIEQLQVVVQPRKHVWLF